jgi:hypothetical protein
MFIVVQLYTTRQNLQLGLNADTLDLVSINMEDFNYLNNVLVPTAWSTIQVFVNAENSRATIEAASINVASSTAVVATTADISAALSSEVSRTIPASQSIIAAASPKLGPVQSGATDLTAW